MIATVSTAGSVKASRISRWYGSVFHLPFSAALPVITANSSAYSLNRNRGGGLKPARICLVSSDTSAVIMLPSLSQTDQADAQPSRPC